MESAFISMVLPTRGRVSSLQRFLRSIMVQTHKPDQLEIIVVVDEDDHESIEFKFPELRIAKKVVQPGQTMGYLNQAGFEVSTGKYIMLVNDDIVIQTEHWDRKLKAVLDKHKNNIVLAHVNDLLFQQELCVFPMISRQYCEIAGGICPVGFNRYRIDNHIFAAFKMVTALGCDSTIFFPFIIFKHLNNIMQSETPRYLIHQAIEAKDEVLFQKLHEERLNVAIEICRRNGIEPSDKAILKLKRDRNAPYNTRWPSKVHLGRPRWQEFNLAMRAAIQSPPWSSKIARI